MGHLQHKAITDVSKPWTLPTNAQGSRDDSDETPLGGKRPQIRQLFSPPRPSDPTDLAWEFDADGRPLVKPKAIFPLPVRPQKSRRANHSSKPTDDFKGRIIIETDREQAKTSARAAEAVPDVVGGVLQLPFFCDRSIEGKPESGHQGRRGGYAVVYKQPFAPQGTLTLGSRGWWSSWLYSSQHSEISGISQSLETAIGLAKDFHRKRGASFQSLRVRVFTDSTNPLGRKDLGLGAPRNFFNEHTEPFVRKIQQQFRVLDNLGCELELRWLPRCSVTDRTCAGGRYCGTLEDKAS